MIKNFSQILTKFKIFKIKFSTNLIDGTVLSFDGPIQNGTSVYVDAGDGTTSPIPDNTWTLDNGIQIDTINGKITNVTTIAATEDPLNVDVEQSIENTLSNEELATNPIVPTDIPIEDEPLKPGEDSTVIDLEDILDAINLINIKLDAITAMYDSMTSSMTNMSTEFESKVSKVHKEFNKLQKDLESTVGAEPIKKNVSNNFISEKDEKFANIINSLNKNK